MTGEADFQTTTKGKAIDGCRKLISEQYGEAYLPDSPRVYKSKSKNAQGF